MDIKKEIKEFEERKRVFNNLDIKAKKAWMEYHKYQIMNAESKIEFHKKRLQEMKDFMKENNKVKKR